MSDDAVIDFNPESGDPDVPQPTPVPQSEKVTLNQFCQHFAAACKPVLLGGFAYQERQAKRFTDTVDAYAERLARFHTTPLG